jgi:iron complex transport system substrate-binding protein
MIKRFVYVSLLLLCSHAVVASDSPRTVRSCDREISVHQAPRRVVVHDLNLAGMLLHLGLKDRIIGYTGFSDSKTREPWLLQALTQVPQLASNYPSLETLLEADPDLFFAGWSYGMRVGGPVTPETLAPFGITVYELTESCSRIRRQPRASLDDLYGDLLNLGTLFSVQAQAQTLVDSLRERVARVRQKLAQSTQRPRVFVYDSGEDRPTTSGQLGMPQALLDIAGGKNIMDDVAASWTQVNWESVVERDPELIVIVDYGPLSWQHKRDFLLQLPALREVRAIREQRFVVLSYMQATPSVENIQAIEQLAAQLHPQQREAPSL